MTDLIYLKDFTMLENAARVVEVLEENGKTVVILDGTIFYPQGGGQPYDQGMIESAKGKFLVEEVRFVDGIVKHIGKFGHGGFEKGDEVMCRVDKARRELHSRLHSAGHVVDMGVVKLGLNWVPGKGYHFSDGPYVEYAGSLEGINTEELKAKLEVVCNVFVNEDRATKLIFMDKSEMHTVCHSVPDYLPEGKPARVVMYGDFGVPCGGTHVSHLGEIQKIVIRKIKQNGPGAIRVGYDLGSISQ